MDHVFGNGLLVIDRFKKCLLTLPWNRLNMENQCNVDSSLHSGTSYESPFIIRSDFGPSICGCTVGHAFTLMKALLFQFQIIILLIRQNFFQYMLNFMKLSSVCFKNSKLENKKATQKGGQKQKHQSLEEKKI